MLSHDKQQEVVEIVRRAGAKLAELWPGDKEDTLERKTKDDGSIVTNADLASNEIIVSGLKNLFPNDGIFSEELPAQEDYFEKEYVWVIDPLDGTSYFSRGSDDFCVLVSRCKNEQCEKRGSIGRAVFGVVYTPLADEMVYGHVGGDVYLNESKVVLPQGSEPRPGKVVARHCQLENRDLEYPGDLSASVAMSMMLSGKIDGVVTQFTLHSEWDIAPFIALATSLGLSVKTDTGEQPWFRYGMGIDFERMEIYRSLA